MSLYASVNLMDKVDRIISIVRALKEDGGAAMVANAPGTQGGFSSSSPAAGPTAGFDPVGGKMMRRKTYATGGEGSRRNWLPKKSK